MTYFARTLWKALVGARPFLPLGLVAAAVFAAYASAVCFWGYERCVLEFHNPRGIRYGKIWGLSMCASIMGLVWALAGNRAHGSFEQSGSGGSHGAGVFAPRSRFAGDLCDRAEPLCPSPKRAARQSTGKFQPFLFGMDGRRFSGPLAFDMCDLTEPLSHMIAGV